MPDDKYNKIWNQIFADFLLRNPDLAWDKDRWAKFLEHMRELRNAAVHSNSTLAPGEPRIYTSFLVYMLQFSEMIRAISHAKERRPPFLLALSDDLKIFCRTLQGSGCGSRRMKS
jgi:hypothetical protein